MKRSFILILIGLLIIPTVKSQTYLTTKLVTSIFNSETEEYEQISEEDYYSFFVLDKTKYIIKHVKPSSTSSYYIKHIDCYIDIFQCYTINDPYDYYNTGILEVDLDNKQIRRSVIRKDKDGRKVNVRFVYMIKLLKEE